MTTDVLIGRNEMIIPPNRLYIIPAICSSIGSMDQKTGTSYDSRLKITEETYVSSTTSTTGINEPKSDNDSSKSDADHSIEKEATGDNCDDSETDDVFEPDTFAKIKEDLSSEKMKLNTHVDPKTYTFREERSSSIEQSLGETYTRIEATESHQKETNTNTDWTSERTTPEIRMDELKEGSYRNEENDKISLQEGNSKCEDRVTTEKRVRLMKSYAGMKDEMERSTAQTVASHLYQQNLLSRNDFENIHETQSRRDSVEALLKRVLMGPNDIYDAFINVLRQSESKHIAEKLDKVHFSDVDIGVFAMLESSAELEKPRPGFDDPRLSFTKPIKGTLKYWLNDKAVVDNINDQFLSRLIFSIDEHTNIADKTMDTKRKVHQLISTMELCSEKILEDFFQILKSETVGIPHVIEKLERKEFGKVIGRQKEKRKSASTLDDVLDVTPPKIQRKPNALGQAKESNIVKTIQESGSNVREKALEFGMVFDSASEGSIILQLTPKDSNSWQILEASCRSGTIKDFIPEVFKNNKSDMEEGEYMLRFKIYILPTPPYSQANKKVIFSLEDEQSTSTYIEESKNLLCQELEITDELLTLLKKEKIVGENIKQDIAKQPRRKKIKCVLDQITQHGDRGYNILKEYTRKENEYLYKQLIEREYSKRMVYKFKRIGTKVTPRPGSATNENRKEIFYTASVRLLVKKSDEERDDVEITCPRIVSYECYFTETDRDSARDDSDQEFLSLEENWLFESKHQENEDSPDELCGKRKEQEDSNKCYENKEAALEPMLKKVDDRVSNEREIKVESTRLPVQSTVKSCSSRKTETTNKTGTDVKKKASKKTQ